MAWIDSLIQHIDANTTATYGVDLFKAGLEDGEGVGDPVIGLVEYSGAVFETMGAGVAISDPKLQLAGRGSTYANARARMIEVHDLLVLITNTTVQGQRFLRVKPNGTLHYLKRDGQGRHQFTQNFDVYL